MILHAKNVKRDMQMNIQELSSKYYVRKLTENDVQDIYELSIGNPMFYQYCPPYVTKESILEDMKALPPKTDYKDKYYIGFFEQNKLVAVMDLISNYPKEDTAYIGLFMMRRSEQGKGIGSVIISECCQQIKTNGYQFVRLGFAKGNPQSESFWKKNGFKQTGIETDNGEYTAVVMERIL